MTNFQRVFLLCFVTISFIFLTTTFEVKGDDDTETVNALTVVIAEYLLNRTDEMNSRFLIYEEAISQILHRLSELEKKYDITHPILEKEYVSRTIKIPNHKTIVRSCADILPTGSAGKNGIYNLTLPNMEAFKVHCLSDPEGGCGWTLVWRRHDIGDDFDRTWSEYKTGFGKPTGNFFIGLEKLHAMTADEVQQLRLGTRYELAHWQSEFYDEFAIGDESTNYELLVLSAYNRSTMFQRLQGHAKFFTKDIDTKEMEEDCAKAFRMGWWYTNDCRNYLKTRAYYSYVNSPTYMVIRPMKCRNDN